MYKLRYVGLERIASTLTSNGVLGLLVEGGVGIRSHGWELFGGGLGESIICQGNYLVCSIKKRYFLKIVFDRCI